MPFIDELGIRQLIVLDVLNNMTTLEVLSMSGNKLEDKVFFEDGHRFGHLPNLTVLEMDRNKFTKLPLDELLLHSKLKRLNVGHNRLTEYDPEFTEMVKLGLDIEYEGKIKMVLCPTVIRNPLICFSRQSSGLQLSLAANQLLAGLGGSGSKSGRTLGACQVFRARLLRGDPGRLADRGAAHLRPLGRSTEVQSHTRHQVSRRSKVSSPFSPFCFHVVFFFCFVLISRCADDFVVLFLLFQNLSVTYLALRRFSVLVYSKQIKHFSEPEVRTKKFINP